MKKRGFTLIELLAVIVILAIIALIMTPIIMNVIEDARVGAAERSAENYISHVRTLIASARVDGIILEDGEYAVQEDGSICPNTGCGKNDANKIEVDMSGDIPTSGTIFIEGETVTDFRNLLIKEKYVSYGTEGAVGGSEETAICTAVKTATRGNVPKGEYANGDEYKCEVKRGKIYTFYVIASSNDKVELIMDQILMKRVNL